MKRARRLITLLVGLLVLWLVVALGLVAWPSPHFSADAEVVSAGPPSVAPAGAEATMFRMRDGASLAAIRFASDGPLVIVLVHGILASSAPYLGLCAELRRRTGAEVIALDLRGHGRSEGARGAVAHIDQYGEDLSDVLTALRQQKASARILVAGHSMGGGILLRYAEMHRTPLVDGYLLFAPLLGPRAPTMTDAPPSRAEGREPAAVVWPRIVGLAMLNALHVRALNYLPVLLFHTRPDEPRSDYSFAALMSMAPHDYRAAMRADGLPLLVLVGANDELFRASRFAEIVALHSHGETLVIDGQDHNSVCVSEPALARATAFIRANF